MSADRKHPSHATRGSDASSFDEICVRCGRRDETGVGWGSLVEPCYVPVAENWIDALPPLMKPEHKFIYLKVVGDAPLAKLLDYRERRRAAEASTWEFCAEIGAAGFWPPDHWGETRTAHLFAFTEKPANEDKAWVFLKPRAKDKHHKAHANKKTDAGKALVERMAARLPYPSENEIAHMLGAIYNVSYHDVDDDKGTRGSGVVGSGFSATAYLEYAGDTLIVRVDNPMPKLKEMIGWTASPGLGKSCLETDGEPAAPRRFQFVGSRYGEDVAATYNIPAWRPPEGFEMISEAEHDLIFAEFRVAEERRQQEAA